LPRGVLLVEQCGGGARQFADGFGRWEMGAPQSLPERIEFYLLFPGPASAA
jgi:hypothetical protein